MTSAAPTLTIPSGKWVRIYKTRLELFNDNPNPVTITADLKGVHLAGIGMRIATGYDANVSMVYVDSLSKQGHKEKE